MNRIEIQRSDSSQANAENPATKVAFATPPTVVTLEEYVLFIVSILGKL